MADRQAASEDAKKARKEDVIREFWAAGPEGFRERDQWSKDLACSVIVVANRDDSE